MFAPGPAPLPARHASGHCRAARRFFATVLGVCLVAWSAGSIVSRIPGFEPHRSDSVFPAAFGVTSVLLLTGSVLFSRALWYVRLEKQRPFRRLLVSALVVGSLFVGVQSVGLWALMPQVRSPEAAQVGVTAFVLMLVSLHALHFLVAVLFLSFVTVRAFDDRYDHEYHWGVTVCAWFWHALGVVWCGILGVFAISAA